MSPANNSTLPSCSAATTDRARRIAGSLKSTPTTRPAGPAISAMTASPPIGPQPQSMTCQPSFLHADPAEGRAGHLPGALSDTQQPPKILIAAVENVAPDPLRDRFGHDRPSLLPRAPEGWLLGPVPSLRRVPRTGLIQHRPIRW